MTHPNSHNQHHWRAIVEEEKYRRRAWYPLVFWIGYAITLVLALN